MNFTDFILISLLFSLLIYLIFILLLELKDKISIRLASAVCGITISFFLTCAQTVIKVDLAYTEYIQSSYKYSSSIIENVSIKEPIPFVYESILSDWEKLCWLLTKKDFNGLTDFREPIYILNQTF